MAQEFDRTAERESGRRQRPPAAAAPAPFPRSHAGLLRLQRAAGNHAVAGAVLQRVPQTAVPTTAVHEGAAITADPAQVADTLKQQVVLKGWDSARGWATRFINMDMTAELRYGELGQGIPRDVLRRLRDVLNEQLDRLSQQRKDFLLEFERKSVVKAGEVLNASEKEIAAQVAALGIKEDTFLGLKTGGYVMDQGKSGALKAATQELITKRREADKAASVYLKARDEAQAIFARNSAPSLAEALPDLILPPELHQRVESSKADGLRVAGEYDALLAEKHKAFPILATVTSGPDALQQLIDLAGRKPDDMAMKIALIAQERLDNIKTVRGDLGGRFSVWKEPHLRDMTKQEVKAESWQSRVIDEKVAAVAAAEQNTQMMIAAIAIGLGLIAAIPTAGGSLVVAGVVTAAAVGSMALSIYGAYEHYEDYRLAVAAQASSFDKAKAISQGEPPDVFWLAVDIVTAIADIKAAAGAFRTVKTLLAEAKAVQSAEKTADMVRAARRAGLSEQTEGRLVAAAMGTSEDTQKVVTSLDQIMHVFKRARKVGGDAELAEAFLKAAEKAMVQERIALYAGTAEEKQAMVLALVNRHAKGGVNAEKRAAELSAQIERAGVAGLYDPVTDTIIVKGNRSPASVAATLAHELAHQKQNLAVGLENMGTMHMEFQAFYAQQQFLRNLNLPPHRVPQRYRWLMTADNAAISAFVAEHYKPTSFGPVTFKNFDESSAWIIKMVKTR
jgi:hypothetical protein